MKTISMLAAAAAITVASAAHAVELDTEIMPMTYFKHAFGGAAKSHNFSTYGLQVHRAAAVEMHLLDGDQPAAFDLRFRDGQLDAMSFGGINTVQKHLVHNADGGTTTATVIDWNMVIPAALAGFVILTELGDDCTPAPAFAEVLHSVPVDSCGNPILR